MQNHVLRIHHFVYIYFCQHCKRHTIYVHNLNIFYTAIFFKYAFIAQALYCIPIGPSYTTCICQLNDVSYETDYNSKNVNHNFITWGRVNEHVTGVCSSWSFLLRAECATNAFVTSNYHGILSYGGFITSLMEKNIACHVVNDMAEFIFFNNWLG